MHQFKRARKLWAQPGAERNAGLYFRKEGNLWGSWWVTVTHLSHKEHSENTSKATWSCSPSASAKGQGAPIDWLLCAKLAVPFLPQQFNIVYLRAYLETVVLVPKANYLNCWNYSSQNITVINILVRQRAFILSQDCSTHLLSPLKGSEVVMWSWEGYSLLGKVWSSFH